MIFSTEPVVHSSSSSTLKPRPNSQILLVSGWMYLAVDVILLFSWDHDVSAVSPHLNYLLRGGDWSLSWMDMALVTLQD